MLTFGVVCVGASCMAPLLDGTGANEEAGTGTGAVAGALLCDVDVF